MIGCNITELSGLKLKSQKILYILFHHTCTCHCQLKSLCLRLGLMVKLGPAIPGMFQLYGNIHILFTVIQTKINQIPNRNYYVIIDSYLTDSCDDQQFLNS